MPAVANVLTDFSLFILRAALALLLALFSLSPRAAPAPVAMLNVEGAIGPAGADYISRAIAHAGRDGAQLVILQMDTPGGLDNAMRSIIKAILAAPMPVVSYVAPSGARAASAGTYILYASHIAAMAPGTNLGAATPVQIGMPSEGKKNPEQDTADVMTHKQVNDAAAYIRGLAHLRGRNAEWAEQAVRTAVSLPAEEALRLHVIDYVAGSTADLLKQLDGKKIRIADSERILETASAPIIAYPPDWRVRLLATITDPSIALILLTIGIYGLIFEFINPGGIAPGVFGGICLLLALYALQLLPVNYAGLALILFGIALMLAEAFLPGLGVAGVGGVIAFIAGAVILIDTEQPGFGIPIGLIVALAVCSALLIVALVGIALKTRRRAVMSGGDALIGHTATVVDDTPGDSWARIGGETWRIVCDTPLRRAQKVRVLGRDGLKLHVAPQEGKQNQTGEPP